MSFWTYMLQCADRHFYVGHTDDLERRMAQHQAGVFPGYTSTRLPVHLVWSEEFATREEAKAVEIKLKGWGKEKKLALIRGDWAGISAAARSKKTEGGASTLRQAQGSARTGWGEVLLHPHLDAVPSTPLSLEAFWRLKGDRLRIRYRLRGDMARLRIPAPAVPARRDELWRHTCFELFAAGAGGGYAEFNVSPSGEWAAYAFDGYRAGMRSLDTEAPTINVQREADVLVVAVALDLPPGTDRLALTAVIEDEAGVLSYWSLAHPPGRPDFHHRDCFALQLPPADGA